MTVRYTNVFTGSNGAAPADLVLSEAGGGAGTQNIQGNKFMQQTSTTAGNTQRAILPVGNWNEADGRVTATFTTMNPLGLIVPQVMARTSGNWDTEIDSPVTGYKALWLTGSGLMLFKRTGGVTTQLGSSSAFSLATLTTYGLSLECVGTTIRARIWTGATPHDATWLITATDAAVAGPGQFQMAMFAQEAAARRVDWDDVVLDDLKRPSPTRVTQAVKRASYV